MIYVIATLTIRPGSAEALREAAAVCIARTRTEKGCLSYELFESLHDPEKLLFVEKWEAREDLTAHSKQPHLAAWRAASAPHVLERRIEIVHPDRVEQF